MIPGWDPDGPRRHYANQCVTAHEIRTASMAIRAKDVSAAKPLAEFALGGMVALT